MASGIVEPDDRFYDLIGLTLAPAPKGPCREGINVNKSTGIELEHRTSNRSSLRYRKPSPGGSDILHDVVCNKLVV
jgi:hypothetical protein